MTAVVDIIVRNNGGWKRTFNWRDTDGNPVALPDSLLMDVRRKVEDAEALVRLNSGAGGGITINNGPGGVFTVELTEAQLKRFGGGKYVHDLVPVTAGKRGQPLWVGTLEVEQGVTR